MVDLDLRVLQLERHHIKDVLALDRVGDQQLGMGQPRGDAVSRWTGQVGPRVNPAVAVDIAVLGYQYALARRIGHAAQHPAARALAVLVEADGRLDAPRGVDRLALDVPENRIKRRP